jgi:hypothetical protein
MVLLNWPPPDHLWIGRKFAPQRSTDPRASIAADILALGPSCVSLTPQLQGIFCRDISEFESHMPSHAVRLYREAAVNYFELPSPLGVRSWPALLAAWRARHPVARQSITNKGNEGAN